MSQKQSTKLPLLLVDGDLIMHQTLAATEREECWDEHQEIWHITNNLVEFKKSIVSQLNKIRDMLKGEIRVCVSSPTNFRKEIFPEYKANRRGTRKPVGFKPAREWLISDHNAIMKDDLEADDVMGILATKPGNDEAVIVSMDKDMKGIPGTLYRWKTQELISISLEDADRQFYTQVLAGDPTDNYAGCPGIGAVKAVEILNKPGDPWANIVAAYAKAGLTEQDALTQARVARILRWSDWNVGLSKPVLWQPA